VGAGRNAITGAWAETEIEEEAVEDSAFAAVNGTTWGPAPTPAGGTQYSVPAVREPFATNVAP
jgi:hypothetical protein